MNKKTLLPRNEIYLFFSEFKFNNEVNSKSDKKKINHLTITVRNINNKIQLVF